MDFEAVKRDKEQLRASYTTKSPDNGEAIHQASYKAGYEAGREDATSRLEELFRYHAPTNAQIPKYGAINQTALNLAQVLEQNCPAGGDLDFAMQLLRLTRMMANAAIALERVTQGQIGQAGR